MSEKQVQDEQCCPEDGRSDRDVAMSNIATQTETDGIYTNEESYVAAKSFSNTHTTHSPEYAELVGIESTSDCFLFSFRLDSGKIETFEFEKRNSSHLPSDLQLLCHYFGIEMHDPEQLRGELVPVRKIESGLTLELGITHPESNPNRSDSSEQSGRSELDQTFTEKLKLLQAILGLTSFVLLFVPLLTLSFLNSFDFTTTPLSVILALSIVSLALFSRSYID